MQLNKDCQDQIIKFAIKEEVEVAFEYDQDLDQEVIVEAILTYNYGNTRGLLEFYRLTRELSTNVKKLVSASNSDATFYLTNYDKNLCWSHSDKQFSLKIGQNYCTLPMYINDIIWLLLKYFNGVIYLDTDFNNQYQIDQSAKLKAELTKMKVKFTTVKKPSYGEPVKMYCQNN